MRDLRAQLLINLWIRTDVKPTGINIGKKGYKLARGVSKRYLSRMFPDKTVYRAQDVEQVAAYYADDKAYVEEVLKEKDRSL